MEEKLLYFAMKYRGDFNQIYKALLDKERVDEEALKRMKKHLCCSYTTIISEDYPEALKQINSPPFVLFYYGDLNLCKQSCISVVGMRDCSGYGKQTALMIGAEIAKQAKVVVSGMAMGIDAYSHLGAINEKGQTIAVLGSGIDYCYPKRNLSLYEEIKKDHLVMSEYPGALMPRKENFPVRNRIVAGLGEKLIVVEAKQRSGTMITVNYALEQGKEVICVPNQLYGNDGCNWLISQGASILVDIKEMF